jgi:hypothetical protein
MNWCKQTNSSQAIRAGFMLTGAQVSRRVRGASGDDVMASGDAAGSVDPFDIAVDSSPHSRCSLGRPGMGLLSSPEGLGGLGRFALPWLHEGDAR